MRVKNTMKNIKYNFIFLIVNLLINFIFRSLFIKILGENIAGFNNLVLNLMGFLNIAELGVGTAITYALYKPLKEKDYKKVNEIMILFKYFYKRIGKIVLVIGLILCFNLHIFVKNQIPMGEAYLYYILFLVNTVAMYFFIYKQTLIIADQKQYVVVAISNSVRIVKLIVQLIVIFLTKNYLYFILLEVIFNVTGLYIIGKKADKIFKEVPFKSKKDIKIIKEENKSILEDIKNVFFHKFASFLVFQTDGILISAFLTLKQTAIYGNYMMIVNGILSLFNGVMSSFTASIGNLIVEKDDKRSYSIFKKLYTFDHFIAIIVSFSLYHLINDFTEIWVGKELLFDTSIVFILVVNVYIQIARGTVEKFKDSYGIFWDKIAPVLEGLINLIISIILIKKVGIIGLFIGTFVSNIVIVLIWKPYVVYKYGFKLNPMKHCIEFIKMIITAIISFTMSFIAKRWILTLLNLDSKNFIGFIGISMVTFLTIVIITFFLFIIKKDFRSMIEVVFGNKFKKVLEKLK